MKDININYEGLNFEEKISLKINYLLFLLDFFVFT